MRPGTVDYSRWDAVDTSSDEEDAPQRAPPAARALKPPQPPARAAAAAPAAPAAPAPAPAAQAALAADDAFSALLPVILSNEGAMRIVGALELEALASCHLLR
jgi:hypothetical protein